MTEKLVLSWEDFGKLAQQLAAKIKESGNSFDGVHGIPRGGLVLGVFLSHHLGLTYLSKPTINTLIVDDISDEGKTLSNFNGNKIATVYSTPWTKVKPDWHVKVKSEKDSWIIFPWENQRTEAEGK